MLTIKIKGKFGIREVTRVPCKEYDAKLIKIEGAASEAGAISLRIDNAPGNIDKVAVAATLIPYRDWYRLFIEAKTNALMFGGEVCNQRFVKGLQGNTQNWVRAINGCKGPRVDLVSSEWVSINPYFNGEVTSENAEKSRAALQISVVQMEENITKALLDISALIWRLYHAYNYLMRRLTEFNPSLKDPYHYDVYGRCLGTYVEYQAQVARWNYHVWKSSNIARVDTVAEKVAITVGYRANECAISLVKITVKIELDQDLLSSDDLGNTDYLDAISSLTLSRNGKVSIPEDLVEDTAIAKHLLTGEVVPVSGTGYEGPGDPKPWRSIVVEKDIENMKKGDAHVEVFALAIATAVQKDLMIPASSEGRTIPLIITIDWKCQYPDGSESHAIKEFKAAPLAVNVITPANDQGAEEE